LLIHIALIRFELCPNTTYVNMIERFEAFLCHNTLTYFDDDDAFNDPSSPSFPFSESQEFTERLKLVRPLLWYTTRYVSGVINLLVSHDQCW